MNESAATVRTTSTITFFNDNYCNHTKQRKFVENCNSDNNNNNCIIFRVNELNWPKKVQSPVVCQRRTIDTNQTANATKRRQHPAATHSTSFIINWNININRRLNSRSRHLLPTPAAPYFGREHILTNLNVHFECDSRCFFHISPKIYSR